MPISLSARSAWQKRPSTTIPASASPRASSRSPTVASSSATRSSRSAVSPSPSPTTTLMGRQGYPEVVRAQERAVLGPGLRPPELQEMMGAERRAVPFLFLRDGDGEQVIVSLEAERMVLGRAPGSDLEIPWDPRVSGVHAYLERRGSRWVIEDDGMSRNGTFVEGERVHGQRTLRDGDVIQVGETRLGFRDPDADLDTRAHVVPTDPALG